MRLLSAAAQSPSPHSEEEALKLFHQLLGVFTRSRAVPRAVYLNSLVQRALWEMLEARYGAEMYVNGQCWTLLWQVIEDDHRWAMEQEKLRREERRAAAEQAKGTGEREQGIGNREEGTVKTETASPASSTPNPREEEAKQGEPAAGRPGQPPPLPSTFEEFLDLFYRAFAPPSHVRELAQDRALIIQLAHSVWERLHVYNQQVRQESEKLGAVFETATQAVTGYEDLRQRAYALEAALGIDRRLDEAFRELAGYLEKDVQQVLRWRFGPAVQREVFPPPPRPYAPGQWSVT
jgi:hypothetical protein